MQTVLLDPDPAGLGDEWMLEDPPVHLQVEKITRSHQTTSPRCADSLGDVKQCEARPRLRETFGG